MKNYETKRLETERLIIDKGDSKSSKSVYEYDLTKCTNIGGVNKLVKFKEPVNFVGNDPVKYYEECKKNKMFDYEKEENKKQSVSPETDKIMKQLNDYLTAEKAKLKNSDEQNRTLINF